MSNLFASSITRRLYLAAAVLSIALTVCAGIAYNSMRQVSADTVRTGAVRVPQLHRVAQMELNVTRVSLQLRHGILSRNEIELNGTLGDIAEKLKTIDRIQGEYEHALVTAKGKELYAKLQPLMKRFVEIGAGNIDLIKRGKKAEAFDFLVERTIPARNAVLAVLSDSVAYQKELLGQELESIHRNADLTLNTLAVLAAGTFAGLMMLAWHVSAVVRRRVRQSQAVAERVRQGDLASIIVDPGQDEFSPLIAALRDMQGSLGRVVGAVRANAESVATASSQIAQGNADLSQRTEVQASAIQQTAATMQQLSTAVNNNTDSAKLANELAQGASSVATQGGQVVGRVVTTMQGISESSRRIGDIIGVIDGIAFQTNILALNAAVEAARAGDQGRGFAVVAGEVRTLAQRSADAAKEIKALIGRSVEQVEQGTVLVGEAGRTMDEIVGSIQQVSKIVGEITAASVEQTSGLAQVGIAVGQMDQMTQQNAALVEQSTAAAESLRSQAQQLVHAVSVFKLNHESAKPSPGGSHPKVDGAKDAARKVPAEKAVTTRTEVKPASPAIKAAVDAATAPTDEWTSF